MEDKVGDVVCHLGKDFSKSYKIELGISCDGCSFYEYGKGKWGCQKPSVFPPCGEEWRDDGNSIIFKLIE